MANYSPKKIEDYFINSDNADSNKEKGAYLEDLIEYLFTKIPGVELQERNIFTRDGSQEIDRAFFNDYNRSNIVFLDTLIIVECKNWDSAVGSSEVGWFRSKLRNKGMRNGIMICVNGITGSDDPPSEAHSVILDALPQDGISILTLNKNEILSLQNTDELVDKLQTKFTRLKINESID